MLFDELGREPFRDGRALDWEADPATAAACEGVADGVRAGAFTLTGAQGDIAAAADPVRRRYEILRGLDRALADAHPLYGEVTAPSLTDARDRYLREGRFSTDAVDGALWARYSRGADEHAALEEPEAAFQYVLRVRDRTLANVERTNLLREPFGPAPGARAEIGFACAPVLGSYDDVEFATRATGYALGPRTESVAGLPVRLLDAMDASGAIVGCLPEATLNAPVLGEWETAIGNGRPDGSRLELVLVGTGPVDGHVSGPRTANEAVLFERVSGEVVLRQRKRSRFTLRPSLIAEWRLGSRLGAEPLTEDIVLGDSLALLECSLGRIAVAICEDAARIAKFGPAIAAAGVSLLLVPVFSKELRQHFWEDTAAKAYANGVGADVLIVNSLAVAAARSTGNPPIDGGPVADPNWHTAMLRGEDFTPARSATANDVVVLP